MDSTKDFIIVHTNQEMLHERVEGKFVARSASLERMSGCCNALIPLLKRQNLKSVMELMKFSLGTPIPRGNLYANQSQIPVTDFPLFQPSESLKMLMETR